MNEDEPILSRAVSVSENFTRCRTANRFYTNFQVIAQYSKPISEDLLYKALRKTLLDYVILACNIYKGDLNCFFKPLPRVLYRDVVSIDLECKVDADFFEFVNKVEFEIYCDKPLFHIWLLADNKVCAAFEHTIMDGVAGAQFHEVLTENLAFVEEKPERWQHEYEGQTTSVLFDYEVDGPKIKYLLPPPPDSFMEHYTVDYSDNDPNHFAKRIPEGTTKWGGRFEAQRDYKTVYNILNFDPQQVKRILAKCKEHEVTLTSYLTIVHALTTYPVIGDSAYCVYKIALDLRRFMNPLTGGDAAAKRMMQGYPEHRMFATKSSMGVPQNLPPVREFSWEAVQEVNTNLLKSVTNNKVMNLTQHFSENGSLVDDNLDYFRSFLGKPRPDGTKVSNLGLIKARHGDWEIIDMIFAQDMAIIAAEFQFNLVSTPKGGLNFVWSYIQDPKNDLSGLELNFRHNVLNCINIE